MPRARDLRSAQPRARACQAHGKVLGAARLLNADLTLEAVAAILVEEGLTTSAIEGERGDLGAVGLSVARSTIGEDQTGHRPDRPVSLRQSRGGNTD